MGIRLEGESLGLNFGKDILSDGTKEVSTSQMGDAIISKLQ